MKNLLIVILCLLPAFMLFGQRVERIVNLIQTGNIDQARQEVENMSETANPPAKLFLQGLLATDGPSAGKLYEKLLETYPDYSHCDYVQFRLSQLKYACGLYISTQKELKHLILKYPNSGFIQKSYYWIGRCFLALQQPDSAAVYFKKVTALNKRTAISLLAESALDSTVAEKNATSTPEETDSAIAIKKWTIQVGAFSRRQAALTTKSFFEHRGCNVKLGRKQKDGRILHLVWVGTFSSRKEARNYGNTLKRKYGTISIPVVMK